jgi:50S ribosomal subunit-associated GTPase HflX
VHSVLHDLEALAKPLVLAANKVDLLDAAELETRLGSLDVAPYQRVVPLSAVRGDGLDRLRHAVSDVLAEGMRPIDAVVPYSQQELVAALHREGFVESERYEESGVRVRGSAPPALAARISSAALG